MEFITRTCYSSYLQTCLLMGLPFVTQPHSTLNEHFNVQKDIVPAADQLPTMRYFAIGNGGHKISVGANGIAKPEPIQHRGTDAALFNHLPFILREVNNDIPTVDRAKYALRRIETHGGRSYIAYYLKRLEFTNVIPGIEYVTVADGISTISTFVPDSSNLNPVPATLSNTGVNVVSGDYVSATAKLGIVFTKEDFTELLNVATVLYNDDSYAIISEIALCSGVDKVVQSSTGANSTINFNEAIIVQVMSFINTFVTPKFSSNGSEILLDVGASESLWTLT